MNTEPDSSHDGPPLAELGFYTLAGQPDSSRDLVDEVRLAERLGLGSVFISERFDKKEAAVLSGAAGAVSERMSVVTAATNHNTRHPMITAGMARTMQSLTGGRFVLGLGRGIPVIQDTYGIDRITTEQLEDFAGLMRRLFRGEAIIGHDGPSGSYPILYLAPMDEYLPLGLTAFGPHSLALGGRCFDRVILHTFFTEQTTRRCVATVKEAAARAGRDPDTGGGVVVLRHHRRPHRRGPSPHEVGRAAGHLPAGLRRPAGADQRLGSGRAGAVPATMTWSPASRQGSTPPPLRTSSATSPPSSPTSGWSPAPPARPSSAPEAVRGQLAMGCDGVIMHGATPAELEPIIAAYRSMG